MNSADRYHVKETIALQDSKTAVCLMSAVHEILFNVEYCLFMEKYVF